MLLFAMVLILSVGSVVVGHLHITTAQSNLTNASVSDNFAMDYMKNLLEKIKNIKDNASKTYLSSEVGMQMNLPEGWTGIQIVPTNLMMGSPAGAVVLTVSPVGYSTAASQGLAGGMSGSRPTTLVISYSNNKTEFIDNVKFFLKVRNENNNTANLSSYEDYLNSAETTQGCEPLEYSVVTINGVNAGKRTQNCPDVGKNIGYTFVTDKGIISISFSGSPSGIDNELVKIDKSIQSVKLDHPVDFKTFTDQIG